ncbi:MAG TPA: hypothetical protein VE934_13625 [Polaromonas sp.]|uniref:hypothetical protein n=1 Tax=Polaromonas sp. TaxID=1869339 RepID=UPI002D6D233B|nr:hypothetical protein [Polaromonas sp.]HYW57998.1 hypothetical protein [Polaromonas sp.]
MKRNILHLLAALLVGVLLTVVVAIGSVSAFLHSLPYVVDDSGFGGAAAIGLLFIIACAGVPLSSIGAYFFLKRWVVKR